MSMARQKAAPCRFAGALRLGGHCGPRYAAFVRLQKLDREVVTMSPSAGREARCPTHGLIPPYECRLPEYPGEPPDADRIPFRDAKRDARRKPGVLRVEYGIWDHPRWTRSEGHIIGISWTTPTDLAPRETSQPLPQAKAPSPISVAAVGTTSRSAIG